MRVFYLCNKGVYRSVAHRRMMLPCSAAQTDPEVHFDKRTKARFADETADVRGEWYQHYLLQRRRRDEGHYEQPCLDSGKFCRARESFKAWFIFVDIYLLYVL